MGGGGLREWHDVIVFKEHWLGFTNWLKGQVRQQGNQEEGSWQKSRPAITADLLGWKTEGEKRRAESGCVSGEWTGPFWGLVEEEKE